jgi:hypothetical protein
MCLFSVDYDGDFMGICSPDGDEWGRGMMGGEARNQCSMRSSQVFELGFRDELPFRCDGSIRDMEIWDKGWNEGLGRSGEKSLFFLLVSWLSLEDGHRSENANGVGDAGRAHGECSGRSRA